MNTPTSVANLAVLVMVSLLCFHSIWSAYYQVLAARQTRRAAHRLNATAQDLKFSILLEVTSYMQPKTKSSTSTDHDVTQSTIDSLQTTIKNQGAEIETLRASLKDALLRTNVAISDRKACETTLHLTQTELAKRVAVQVEQQRWMTHWHSQVMAANERERKACLLDKSVAKLSANREALLEEEGHIRKRVIRTYKDLKEKRSQHDAIVNKLEDLADKGITWESFKENQGLQDEIKTLKQTISEKDEELEDLEASNEKKGAAMMRMKKAREEMSEKHKQELQAKANESEKMRQDMQLQQKQQQDRDMAGFRLRISWLMEQCFIKVQRAERDLEMREVSTARAVTQFNAGALYEQVLRRGTKLETDGLLQ